MSIFRNYISFNAKALVNHFQAHKNALCPPGTVISYISSSTPAGWLLCDGSAYSRVEYLNLFKIIGTTYGAGDGTTTFNVPDLRGRTTIGFGAGAGLTNRDMAVSGGAETHTLTTAEMPSHNHDITDPGHTHSYVNNVNDQNTDNAFSTETAADSADLAQTTGTSTTGITINNTGGGGAHNNMQPFVVLNYLIKA
jgi:microcystin-dependent protein